MLARDDEEVLEGFLVTPDRKHWYPVVGGVPRMLPGELGAPLAAAFAERHCEALVAAGIESWWPEGLAQLDERIRELASS